MIRSLTRLEARNLPRVLLTVLAVTAAAAAAARVTGTFATITRSDGAVQATFDGHPLYTFAGDTAPG